MGLELTKDGGDIGLGKGGARGGGARGGGSFVGSGGARIIFDNASSLSTSSISSLALGTMSERNSRSSDDRAIEFRGLALGDLLDLENRPKNRETAEGTCASSSGPEDATLASILLVVEISAIVDIVAGGVVSTTLADWTTELAALTSTLGRGEAMLDRGDTAPGVFDRTGEDEPDAGALVVDFLPKNESKPPVVFLLVSFIDC